MILDNNYKYELINKDIFDMKHISCIDDGSLFKKYILICYKENNNIKYVEVTNKDYINKFDNIIKIYDIEEIISSCTQNDIYYKKISYYHVDDIYFTKYLMDNDKFIQFKNHDDKENIFKYFN